LDEKKNSGPGAGERGKRSRRAESRTRSGGAGRVTVKVLSKRANGEGKVWSMTERGCEDGGQMALRESLIRNEKVSLSRGAEWNATC